MEWCERLRPSVDVEWWEGKFGNKRKDSLGDEDSESPKRPKKAVVSSEGHDEFESGCEDSPTPLLTPPPKGGELEWPCGLTVDCGMMR